MGVLRSKGIAALAGCAIDGAGDVATLELTVEACTGVFEDNEGGIGLLGGGGSGAIPILPVSLIAAAAAAEAYLRTSPGGLVGGGAGFIVGATVAAVAVGSVCSDAKAGSGDFMCCDGRRGATVISGTVFGFGLAISASTVGSGESSGDCGVSCDVTRSISG